MSSWPGTVLPRWRTSSSSRVGVLKASAFHFVSRTVCSPYPTLNLQRPSFSSRRCADLEQSSAAYYICSVTSCLLLSLEDILLRTLFPIITVVLPAKWHCHLWTQIALTYLLIYHPYCLLSPHSIMWYQQSHASPGTSALLVSWSLVLRTLVIFINCWGFCVVSCTYI